LYRLLAEVPYRDRIPWHQVHFFWADERCVPPDDPGSNYRLARETLIDRISIPADNVHRVRGELEPDVAARTYERALTDYFCGPRTRFDLVLLGVGGDGHTASLFPGAAALQETERLVQAVVAHYEERPASRVTLTLPAINTARHVWFLVTGSTKAGIVQAVLEEPDRNLPAQQVCPTAGVLTWLLDAAASGQLRRAHD
jgi:6-phosphogluconolactonase